MGGAFTTVDSIAYGGLVRLTSTGTLDQSFRNPALNGTATSVVIGANGAVYAAGTFTAVAGVSSVGLAAFFTNGARYPIQTAVPNNTVNTLLNLANGSLLVLGQFTVFGEFGRQRVAKLDFTTVDTINAPYAGAASLPRYTVVTLEKRATGSWVVTESNAS